MKKLFITSLFVLGVFSQNCFGQLKVDSLGHVGISCYSPNSILSVGGNGHESFTAQFAPVTGRKAVCIYNMSYTTEYPLGLYIKNTINDTIKTIGEMIGARMDSVKYYSIIKKYQHTDWYIRLQAWNTQKQTGL